MKVVFDAERLRNPHSGLGQFCTALGHALIATQPPESTLTFMTPPDRLDAFGAANTKPTAWWQRYNTPMGADVWHATHQDYWIRPPAAARVVLSIMDLNFLERAGYSDAKKQRRLAAVQKKVDRADAIATISEFTASVVRRHLDVPDVPVRVIHLGNPLDRVGPKDESMPPDQRLDVLAPNTFFFFIGAIHPKKNVHTLVPLLRSFPGMSLVLAGPNDGEYTRVVRRAAESAGVADRVILSGTVSEARKVWLYRRARALLFPSLSEGFGLPVVEAMSVGKPVFLSRLTSLPEIGGDAAFYFDSFEPESMIETLRRGLADHDAHPGRGDELRRHAAQFSWEEAARAYWTLYAEVHRSPRR